MAESHKYSLLEHLLFPPKRLNTQKLEKAVKGKTVVITGASFGIGEQLAHRLAAVGAHVVGVARTLEKLEALKIQIESNGGKATIFPSDLTQPDQVKTLIEQLNGLPGGVDILVSNAGKSIKRPLMESLDRFHDFTRTNALNYLGPVQLTLGLIPLLKAHQGQVINISAINVLLAPAPYWAAYQASKAAFDQWFRCAMPELNAAGVATTSLYLPLVKTRMIAPNKAYDKMPAMTPDHVARIICRHMLSRKRKWEPWWNAFGRVGSVILRGPWEFFATRFVKKKNR